MGDDLILEKKYSRILLTSSLLAFPLSIYAHELNLTYLYRINLLLLFTSINYWIEPKYGFRRNLDIFAVVLQVLSNLYATKKVNKFHREKYRLFLILVFFLEKISWDIHNSDPMLSTFFHSLIHIMCFLGNSILYSQLYFLTNN